MSRTALRLVILTALMSLLIPAAGCARRVTDFTVISTKNTMLVAHAEKRERRIEGEDCSFTLFGLPNMKTAIDDALDKAGPEYDALVDGVIYYDDRFLYVCYRVEGTPLRALKEPHPKHPEVDDGEVEYELRGRRSGRGERIETERGTMTLRRKPAPTPAPPPERAPVAEPAPAPAPPVATTSPEEGGPEQGDEEPETNDFYEPIDPAPDASESPQVR